MSQINHKAVYECREFEARIYATQSAVRAAELKVEKARQAYRDKCAKVAGCAIDVLEFSNVMCLASGISHHVYHIRRPVQGGSPDNKCIFCGCDNWRD